ncbi:nitronate monooxygenase family protein [Microbacterium lacus]|uniref:NAD(P)H-dependent flavin oxidoreductase n=1 Tax=Microbacterium lacus TaxID=415217 RepID=UPI003851715A
MQTKICQMLGIDIPVLAFSHCRDVVAAVSKSGGYGVLGAVLMSPAELEAELTWIDEHVGGAPYGIDLMLPTSLADGGVSPDAVQLPADAVAYRDQLLREHDIDPDSLTAVAMATAESFSEHRADELIDVALAHGVTLIASALGPPPAAMVEKAHAAGAYVAALVGNKKHALRQLERGVDVIVAQGYEAGGHTGEIGTIVLTAEIVQTVNSINPDVPVLAAGGIMNGHQLAASVALGAAGAWCGSVWLTSREAETEEHLKRKMLEASSSDTVRSKYRTGKPSRQLRSAWHAGWEAPGAPASLEMPLMGYLSEPALQKASLLADGGHVGATELSTYWVGQGVGLMNQPKSVAQIMADFAEGYIEAVTALTESIDE